MEPMVLVGRGPERLRGGAPGRGIVLCAAALGLFLVVATAPALRAQLAEARPGMRVRIEAPGVVAGKYAGTVLGRDEASIRIAETNAPPVDVPLARITSLEISRGSSRLAGAGRGALFGAAIGLGIGLVSASTISDRDSYYDTAGRRHAVDKGALVVASAYYTAITGAMIGAFVPKERWERFDVAAHTGLGDGRRVQLGMRVGF